MVVPSGFCRNAIILQVILTPAGVLPNGKSGLQPFISVDKYRYATSVFVKYLNNSKIKENSKFHKNNLPHYMIFTK